MRVVEPHQFKTSKKKKKPNVIKPLLVVVALIGLGLGANTLLTAQAKKREDVKNTVQLPLQPQAVAPKTTPKTLTGNQFRDLYRAVMTTYPNTQTFPEAPTITGNVAADDHIRKLAEARGFKMTRIPVTALVKTDEPRLAGETDDLLQPLAFQGWQAIKAAAQKDNVPLVLNSAYRSPDWQRDLFLQRLTAKGVSPQDIADGLADNAVIQTLSVTAVPGYSRHHTGYTVDFWCEDGTGNFTNSSCFTWLSKDNYAHAKAAGWIPSYPPGADEQGPEPESWEYVWVGKEVLYQ